MPENVTQSLRDVILLEIDWLTGHAVQLEQWGLHTVAVQSPFLKNAIKVTAAAARQRAAMLRDVLAATEPEAKAS
jgi:hypothetical protein